ncbi:MAG: polysaccharide deacetylase family protein [Alphaproteobacteria bacterium]
MTSCAGRTVLDPALFPYSPLPARAPLAWPGGKPVAVWIAIILDDWEIEPPADGPRVPGAHGPWDNIPPDYRTWSYRAYGPRVGIHRLVDVLARHRLRATLAADSASCARYPEIIADCQARGFEIAAHGSHATRVISARMSEQDEAETIARAADAVSRITGNRPAGWIGPEFGESEHTPRLLAEAGFTWVADWPNDEQPYPLGTTPPLMVLPYSHALDDQELIWLRHVAPWDYPRLIGQALDRLALDGAASGRVLGLGIRPWLFGRPHRVGYFAEAVARIAAHPAVWCATGGEIITAGKSGR